VAVTPILFGALKVFLSDVYIIADLNDLYRPVCHLRQSRSIDIITFYSCYNRRFKSV